MRRRIIGVMGPGDADAAIGNGRVHVAADARDAIALIKRLLPTA